jgi:hypothetical protein
MLLSCSMFTLAPFSPLLQISFYTLRGTKVSPDLLLPPEVTSEGVAAAVLYGDGVVVLTAATYQLWAIVGWSSRRPRLMPPVPGITAAAGQGEGAAPGLPAIAVLEPKHTLSRALEVGVGSECRRGRQCKDTLGLGRRWL